MTLATDDQIKEWKEQHGNVFKFISESDNVVCYLRQPTRQELSYAGKVGATDALKYNDYILKACWLGGDEEIRTKDMMFLGISEQLDQICQFTKFQLEKL